MTETTPSPNGPRLSPGRQAALTRRRQRMLDAAATLLFSGGYDNLAVRDVADAAGLSTRTLYNHFVSKEYLVVAVVTDLARTTWVNLADNLPDTIPPTERARQLLDGASHALVNVPDVAGAIVRAMGSRQPELVPLLVDFDTTMRDALTRALAHGEPTERDVQHAIMLQQVWFTAMVSWISGVQDPGYMNRSVDTALTFIESTSREKKQAKSSTGRKNPPANR